ncbi:MAG TPA: complex I subunit 1 family protein, partial [Isosphaeraceae bacterium]|nr:complex I subunit 1 family protein [Isosphaeraceae bacterium]
NQQVEHNWFLFSPPGLLSFAILTISSIAEVNRTPFDLPEAESEIIAGYHTEYSGMRFGLFFLAEYLSVFGVSCVGTVLFLGGGTLPFAPDFPFRIFGTDTWPGYLLTNSISVAIFSAKIVGYIFLMFWIRATLPRMRVDRLMNFAWKYLVPLAVLNIVYAAIWFEYIFRPVRHLRWNLNLWLFTLPIDRNGLAAWAVTLPLVVISIWAVIRLNRVAKVNPEVMPGPGKAAGPGNLTHQPLAAR